MKTPSRICLSFALLTGLCACQSKPEPEYQAYYPVTRTAAPEAVYSRVTWSHLPQPGPERSLEKTPLLQPTMSFDLPNSNLREAIEAVAQTIGYSWRYPSEMAGRKISLKMVGTVVEILDEISRQANVRAVLKNDERIVLIVAEPSRPTLPSATLSNAPVK